MKYHDSHQLGSYRIITTMDTACIDDIKGQLNIVGIELMCIATHYSDRYGTSEIYLEQEVDSNIKDVIKYFNINTTDSIISDFINVCIEPVSDETTQLGWKDMHYIWKLYLQGIGMPNIIYSNKLQSVLTSRLDHTCEGGNIIFRHITSKYLPYISSFLSFWDKYVTITDSNKPSNEDTYELDELIAMYKHCGIKYTPISEDNLIKILNHYFPTIEIDDNKWMCNIKCSIWTKTIDIDDFLQYCKQNPTTYSHISGVLIDDLYKGYTVFTRSKLFVDKKPIFIASKYYFENYIATMLEEYIDPNGLLIVGWI